MYRLSTYEAWETGVRQTEVGQGRLVQQFFEYLDHGVGLMRT